MKKAYIQPTTKTFAIKTSGIIAQSYFDTRNAPSTSNAGIRSNDAKDEEDSFDW